MTTVPIITTSTHSCILFCFFVLERFGFFWPSTNSNGRRLPDGRIGLALIYDCRPCFPVGSFPDCCIFAKNSSGGFRVGRENLFLNWLDGRQNPQCSGSGTRSASSVRAVFTYTSPERHHVTDVLIPLNNNAVPVFGHGEARGSEFRFGSIINTNWIIGVEEKLYVFFVMRHPSATRCEGSFWTNWIFVLLLFFFLNFHVLRRTDQQTALSIFFQEVSVANCGGGGHAHHLHYNQVRCCCCVRGVFNNKQKKFSFLANARIPKESRALERFVVVFLQQRTNLFGKSSQSILCSLAWLPYLIFDSFGVLKHFAKILISKFFAFPSLSSYVRQPIHQRHPQISLTPWPPLPNSQLQINTVPRQVCCRCKIFVYSVSSRRQENSVSGLRLL